jgi:hypothetical protein
VLRKGDVEIPSDLYGVVYIDLDPGGGWKHKLVAELAVAGLEEPIVVGIIVGAYFFGRGLRLR